MEGAERETDMKGRKRAGSMLDLATQSEEEAHRIRMAIYDEGLIEQIFDLLRRVPRRVLMVLKLK